MYGKLVVYNSSITMYEEKQMSVPRKACNIQLVEIQHGERLAITPEPTFAPDRATCLREAKGRGYRATTQVKGLSQPAKYLS